MAETRSSSRSYLNHLQAFIWRLRTPEDYDTVVWAEIPDQEQNPKPGRLEGFYGGQFASFDNFPDSLMLLRQS